MPEKTEQMSGGREYCGLSDQQKGHSINIYRDYIRTSGFALQGVIDRMLISAYNFLNNIRIATQIVLQNVPYLYIMKQKEGTYV